MNIVKNTKMPVLLEESACSRQGSSPITTNNVEPISSAFNSVSLRDLDRNIKSATSVDERSVYKKYPIPAHEQLVHSSFNSGENPSPTHIVTNTYKKSKNDDGQSLVPLSESHVERKHKKETSISQEMKNKEDTAGPSSAVRIDESTQPLIMCEEPDNVSVSATIERRTSSEASAESLNAPPCHKQIIDHFISFQNLSNVDKTSYQTMIESLEFAGINTLKEANDLNLRIIPPGPVFHTWWAQYGTGIFDGTNNPPHVKRLNYVQRIEEQASRLKEWHIPVFIVYLERDMEEDELEKMRTLFKDHNNIIMLSVEKDLSSIITIDDDLTGDYLDELRGYVCKEFPAILEKIKEKIKSKPDYIERLNLLNGDSIIYSDIDNTFIRRPLYQIVQNGFRKASVITDRFALTDGIYNNNMTPIVVGHRQYFAHEGYYFRRIPRFPSDYLLGMGDSLYQYLLTGEAFQTHKKIIDMYKHQPTDEFWDDVGYISVDKKALNENKEELKSLTGGNWIRYFTIKNIDTREVQSMLALQQIKHFHCGRDRTWRK
ncbi:MAG: hypothetical protein KAG53_03255 [Endozoicomonadaceae bacterium]|nr:hypothetical protein [Endozoicomonadaceae bacterium]